MVDCQYGQCIISFLLFEILDYRLLRVTTLPVLMVPLKEECQCLQAVTNQLLRRVFVPYDLNQKGNNFFFQQIVCHLPYGHLRC